MRWRTLAGLGLSAQFTFGLAMAQVSVDYLAGGAGPIPDGGVTATSPGDYGPPRDLTFDVVGRVGTVSRVSIAFSADHPFVGDLRVTLIAPNGESLPLFARTGANNPSAPGAPGNLVSTNTYEFNDSATVDWWTHVGNGDGDIGSVLARTMTGGGAVIGIPTPNTSFDFAFASTPPNGRWILRFEDGSATHIGSVASAQLRLITVGSTRYVFNDADAGIGSLRQALLDAEECDLIAFASPYFDASRTITLQTALPVIDRQLAIEGPGAHRLTVRRADEATDFRILTTSSVDPGIRQSYSGFRVSNGRVISDGGGGIRSTVGLTLSAMHVDGNQAASGGGLFASGRHLSVINSTISGNRALQFGGGAFLLGVGVPYRMLGTTVSGNVSDGPCTGIMAWGAHPQGTFLDIVDSTLADNLGPSISGLCAITSQATALTSATIQLRSSVVDNGAGSNFAAVSNGGGAAAIKSLGFNLSDDFGGSVETVASDLTGNAHLGPLALHGGTVPTHPLLAGSDALDRGDSRLLSTRSAARGEQRVFDDESIANAAGGDGADIGAVEMQALHVSTDADTGSGSLRQAITDSNANGPALDDVLFDVDVFDVPRTIALQSELPAIAGGLAIHGPAANRLSVCRNVDHDDFSVFTISPTPNVVALSGLTICNGRSSHGGGVFSQSPLTLAEVVVADNVATSQGGGVFVHAADAQFSGSTIHGNRANFGGGLSLNAFGAHRFSISGSTVSGNEAITRGGGVHLYGIGSGDLDVSNATIADNHAGEAGGIHIEALTLASWATSTLRNTIIANPGSSANFGAAHAGSPGGAINRSRGFNLIDDAGADFASLPSDRINANAALAALADNGGPTPTHALQAGSDALDGGHRGVGGPAHDQRGAPFRRRVDLTQIANAVDGDGTDIGSIEMQSAPPSGADDIFGDGFGHP